MLGHEFAGIGTSGTLGWGRSGRFGVLAWQGHATSSSSAFRTPSRAPIGWAGDSLRLPWHAGSRQDVHPNFRRTTLEEGDLLAVLRVLDLDALCEQDVAQAVGLGPLPWRRAPPGARPPGPAARASARAPSAPSPRPRTSLASPITRRAPAASPGASVPASMRRLASPTRPWIAAIAPLVSRSLSIAARNAASASRPKSDGDASPACFVEALPGVVEVAQRARRGVDAAPGEVDGLAVVRRGDQVAEGAGGHGPAPGDEVRDRVEVAEALRHLPAVHQEVAAVHPVAHERSLAGGRLALGDLVLVVREAQVLAAEVDVDLVAEERGGHHGALDVPAGPPLHDARARRRR